MPKIEDIRVVIEAAAELVKAVKEAYPDHGPKAVREVCVSAIVICNKE